MKSRSRRHEMPPEFDIWPAFTDLMSNAFMILSFLLLLAIIKPLVSISSMRETEEALRQQLLRTQIDLTSAQNRATLAESQVAPLVAQNRALAAQTQTLQGQLQQEMATPKAPPIIVIRDTGAYQFSSGSAQLPDALETYVRNQLVPQIEANAAAYNINVIEIIGHTDGQPNNASSSNLDRSLPQVAAGTTPVNQLVPGSNADLGLMRALAVVQILQTIQGTEGKLQGLQFRPYSAAQLVSPTGNFGNVNPNPDESRRRIEIRFTRLGEETSVQ
ncbi:hypothetical protein [Laspinema palackyanum]|uniref:Flagellar motor protein n=1 Tax=Laspinema palackyanum D2a TaxID=2953684 RepID=A0ABT2MKY6_9CYAN|nr:hypothetical protein [Laspinema sp. D2c]MCT7964056.1 hypothetical protein [Laspinema sp. D2b]MCT7965409.1 hypothetical protein [Laspinema sp. D2a]